MSATLVTLLGTVGVHGIAADETGLVIRSLKHKTRKQSNFLKNRVGNRVGRADYDHSIEVTMEGEITSSSGFAQRVSAELAVTNAIATTHLPSGAGTGLTLIDDVEQSMERESWKDISVSAEVLPCFPTS
jgi:hypothetical protein